jgi:formimidoylglutamate deiminase
LELTSRRTLNNPLLRIGAAPHSLRAVPSEELREIVTWRQVALPDSPIHIHVSEQRREVEECLVANGQPPITWLAEHIGIDKSWTLIHATHAAETELQTISESGATVGLCPVTEANLGDGLFPFPDLSRQPIKWGIGSDSNVRIDAIEELRLLEYGQRLKDQRRSVLTDAEIPDGKSPGRAALWAISNAAERSLSHRVGRFKPGYRADLVVLDPSHPALEGHGLETVLDALMVSGDRGCVSDVMVAGRWVVRERHHIDEDAIVPRWRSVRSQLLG